MDFHLNFFITDFSKRLLVTIFTLLVLTNLSVGIFKDVPRNWSDSNIIQGQRYMTHSHPEVVLLGASITAHLKDLRPSIHNLSLSSSSALTGLLIMQKNEKLPHTVIVDVNYLFNDVSEEIISEVDNLSMKFPFRYFAVFTKEVSFFSLIKNLLATYILSPLEMRKNKTGRDFDLVDFYVRSFFKDDFDRKAIKKNVTHFGVLVQNLQKKGVRFKFFETPIPPKFYLSKKHQFTRKILLQFISEKQISKPIKYKKELTTDGIHLNSTTAIKLAQKINEIL